MGLDLKSSVGKARRAHTPNRSQLYRYSFISIMINMPAQVIWVPRGRYENFWRDVGVDSRYAKRASLLWLLWKLDVKGSMFEHQGQLYRWYEP
jgi:hypothetical protein